MARLDPNEVKVGIGMGSTWDTARDLTGANVGRLLHCSSFDDTGGFTEFVRPDIGADNFETTSDRQELNLNVSMAATMTYDGIWMQLLAALMGTVTSVPAETTGGQGDYAHNIDLASKLDSRYLTMGQLVEDDYVKEFPSVKMVSGRLEGGPNRPGTFTGQGIASRVLFTPETPTNTAAEVAALTDPTYNPASLGGTNHYLRINAQAGGSLSGSNDIPILGWSIDIARPMSTRHVLRGVNTAFTKEPIQNGPTVVGFGIQLDEATDSTLDLLAAWKAGTEYKAELFMDGLVIGTTVNRSIKFQLPRIKLAVGVPTGYGVSGATGDRFPSISFKALKPTAAPTGMSGVTSPLRVALVHTRVQSFFN
jgi:hypothetical protein